MSDKANVTTDGVIGATTADTSEFLARENPVGEIVRQLAEAATPKHKVRHTEAVRFEAVEDENSDRPSARVRIIRAGMSLNGRMYPSDVLAEGSHLYSRSKMMLDHPDPFVGYEMQKLAGVYGEAEWDREQEGVVANLHFLTNTPAGQVAFAYAQEEVALREEGVLGEDDRLFGVSHVAYTEGKWVSADDDDNELGRDYYEVTRIVEVLSGDFVVFEAADGKILDLKESIESRVRDRCQREGVDVKEEAIRGVVRSKRWRIGAINVKVR